MQHSEYFAFIMMADSTIVVVAMLESSPGDLIVLLSYYIR